MYHSVKRTILSKDRTIYINKCKMFTWTIEGELGKRNEEKYFDCTNIRFNPNYYEFLDLFLIITRKN